LSQLCPFDSSTGSPQAGSGQAGVRESSGVDGSGNPIAPVTPLEAAEFNKLFGETISCEKGCTVFRGFLLRPARGTSA